jgi:hypothetical protein
MKNIAGSERVHGPNLLHLDATPFIGIHEPDRATAARDRRAPNAART